MMMMVQLQWSFLLRISNNAKLTVLVSCVDACSLLHWFQTPLCGRHVLQLVAIKFCLTKKCIDSWYICLEGCQLILRNLLAYSEGGSMNIPSGMWRLVAWWIGTGFAEECAASIFSVDIYLPLVFKARHHRFCWSMAKEMIAAWKWACLPCCGGVNAIGGRDRRFCCSTQAENIKHFAYRVVSDGIVQMLSGWVVASLIRHNVLRMRISRIPNRDHLLLEGLYVYRI